MNEQETSSPASFTQDEEVRMPHFVVVGAAKAGTTSLHHYLRQNPDVFLPEREEPSFFAFEGEALDFRSSDGTGAAVNRAITNIDAYAALYRDAHPGQVRGDVSPVYLYWPGTASRIRRHSPEAKILAVLRNPVDRAHSAYMHAVREGREPLGNFAAATAAEPGRIAENWGFLWRYQDLGRYAHQVAEYLDVFPRHQVRFLLFDDLQADPIAFMKDVHTFIGAGEGFEPRADVQYNVSGVPRSALLHRLGAGDGPLGPLARRLVPVVGKDRLRRWQARVQARNVRRQSLDEILRRRLLEDFSDDIRRTSALTGLDLSRWLQPEVDVRHG